MSSHIGIVCVAIEKPNEKPSRPAIAKDDRIYMQPYISYIYHIYLFICIEWSIIYITSDDLYLFPFCFFVPIHIRHAHIYAFKQEIKQKASSLLFLLGPRLICKFLCRPVWIQVVWRPIQTISGRSIATRVFHGLLILFTYFYFLSFSLCSFLLPFEN